MSQSEKFLRDFYSPNGQHVGKVPLKKDQNSSGEFYKPVKFADLSKSLDDAIIDPTAVLDFHMRKASEKEEDNKRGKKRRFGGGLQ